MDQRLEELKTIALRHVNGLQTSTAVPRLTLWFNPQKTDPILAMLEPKVYLLVQGAKRLTIGSRSFDYTTGSCTVSSLGLPFNVQVIDASPLKPYLGIELKFNAAAIASLVLEIPEERGADGPAISVMQATADIVDTITRLARLLDSPKDIPVLAPLIERELYYRLLQSPLGGTMRQAVKADTRIWQIRKAVERIGCNATASLSVKELAESVGMSVTSFHRHFKDVTALSPFAYQQHVRLLEARRMLATEATNVTAVAFAVGYTSSSQFSREYSRMFGMPPKRDITRLRETL